LLLYHNKIINSDECLSECRTGTFKQDDRCLDCDSRCKSCKNSTNKNCTECSETAEFSDNKTCECKKGLYFDFIYQKCISCPNPLCESCDPSSTNDMTCLKCIVHQNIISKKISELPLKYECKCKENTYIDPKSNFCIYENNECHKLCKDGCYEFNNPLRCVSCQEGINIGAIKNGNSNYDCSCINEAVLIGDKCGFQECDTKYCAGCYYKNNKTSCFACVNGIVPVFNDSNSNNDRIVECRCPLNQFYINSTCVSPKNESCHPLCNDSCLLPNDNSKCISCKEGYISQLLADGYFNCTCPIGSIMNSLGTCDPSCGPLCEKCINNELCEKCLEDEEVVILSSNKCKCSSMKDYTLQEGKCVKKTDSQAQSIQTTGLVFMGVVVSTSVIGPGIGSSFWAFIGISQEFALMAIINSPNVTQSFISIIQGSSFVSFQFLDALFEYFPAEIRGDIEYNLIEEGNFANHPCLAGKMFLVNIMSQLFIFIISIFCYLSAALLALKFAYFQAYKRSFVFCGMIRLVQACFNDIILCAFIQLKYPSLKNSQYYAMNYFIAIFALIFECAFIVANFLVIKNSARYLTKHKNKEKYGAFYEDCKIFNPLKFTPFANNIRLLIMICLMVYTVDYNIAQSIIYFISALASFAWELCMSPYEEKLITLQMNALNLVKLAASIGFLLVCSPLTSEKVISWIYKYETGLFLTSLCIGMLISLIQQIQGTIEMIKNYCRKKSPEMVYIENSFGNISSHVTQNIENSKETFKIEH